MSVATVADFFGRCPRGLRTSREVKTASGHSPMPANLFRFTPVAAFDPRDFEADPIILEQHRVAPVLATERHVRTEIREYAGPPILMGIPDAVQVAL